MSSKNYRALSLDVSSACTGWSFITNRKNSLKLGKITPKKTLSLPEKLTFFRNELLKVLKKYKPTHIVIEDTFLSRNPKVVKLLAKFGGVAEQTVHEYTDKEPYVISNTTPKSFFKVRSKEDLFPVVLNIIDLDAETHTFKEWNDIIDSVAQLLCYCDSILNVKQVRQEKEYGFRYTF